MRSLFNKDKLYAKRDIWAEISKFTFELEERRSTFLIVGSENHIEWEKEQFNKEFHSAGIEVFEIMSYPFGNWESTKSFFRFEMK